MLDDRTSLAGRISLDHECATYKSRGLLCKLRLGYFFRMVTTQLLLLERDGIPTVRWFEGEDTKIGEMNVGGVGEFKTTAGHSKQLY